MRSLSIIFLFIPLILYGQQELPAYSNGTGFPLDHLHPDYNELDSYVLWIPAEEFWGEYGFRDINYVSRENENHGGGMHHTWNITSLKWDENGLSLDRQVHYDTTFLEVDKFVRALPGLEEARSVNGNYYALGENDFLESWGFHGYGSGFEYFLQSFAFREGYYLYVYQMEKHQAEEELMKYWFLNGEGLPLKEIRWNEEGDRQVIRYRYDEANNFIGYEGEAPFLTQFDASSTKTSLGKYQLYANESHFESQVKEKFGYYPHHILVGFWRFGYVHFAYIPGSNKYVIQEIVPFF